MEQNFLKKFKKLLAFFTMIFLVNSFSFAQESNLLFPRNLSFINPAFSGLQNKVDVSSHLSWPSSRVKWAGNNPLLFNADFKLAPINSGVGINFFTDQANDFANRDSLGSYNFSESYQFNYNYQIDFSGSTLSLGVMAQYKRRNWNSSLAIPAKGFEDTWLFGAGAAWKRNNLTVGASVLQSDRLSPFDGSSLKQIDFHVHAQYKFTFGQDWHLTPSALYANLNDGNSTTIVFDAKAEFQKWFHFGANLSQGGTLPDIAGGYAGITILKSLQFEYRLSSYISATTSNNLLHGVSLRYFIEKEK